MGEVCFSLDVQLRSMCYVMVMCEVTTHDPKVFTLFPPRKGYPHLPFHHAQEVHLAGSSPRVRFWKTEEY